MRAVLVTDHSPMGRITAARWTWIPSVRGSGTARWRGR